MPSIYSVPLIQCLAVVILHGTPTTGQHTVMVTNQSINQSQMAFLLCSRSPLCVLHHMFRIYIQCYLVPRYIIHIAKHTESLKTVFQLLPQSSLGLFLATSSLYIYPPSCVFHLFQLLLPSFLLICLTISIISSCFSASLTSTFLTLSSLVTPSTLLRYAISVVCSLLSCLIITVHISQPYNMVGSTIVLYIYSLIFEAFFNSPLFSTSFHIAPITLTTAVGLCSIPSSHVPSAVNIAPRYYMFCNSISSPSTHTLHSSPCLLTIVTSLYLMHPITA